MTKFQQAYLTGVKVLGHYAIAIVVLGLVDLLSRGDLVANFSTKLATFGIPLAITNIITASVIKFLTAEEAKLV